MFLSQEKKKRKKPQLYIRNSSYIFKEEEEEGKGHKMMKDNAKMGSKWAFLWAGGGPVPSPLSRLQQRLQPSSL